MWMRIVLNVKGDQKKGRVFIKIRGLCWRIVGIKFGKWNDTRFLRIFVSVVNLMVVKFF